MSDVTFFDRKRLTEIGLRNSDIVEFIDNRIRIGNLSVVENFARLAAELTPTGRKRLEEVVAERADSDDDRSLHKQLNHLNLEISPSPPMLTELDYELTISFHRQIDDEIYTAKEEFTLRGPNHFQLFDISLRHLIHTTVRGSDGEIVAERILSPSTARELDSTPQSVGEWVATPRLQEKETAKFDGRTLFVRLNLDTLRDRSKDVPIEVASTRFERSGRYQIVGVPDFRFDGYTLSVALVRNEDSDRIAQLLGTSGNLTVSSKQSDGCGRWLDPILLWAFSLTIHRIYQSMTF